MRPSWFTRDIAVGDVGADVDIVRRKLGLRPGAWDEDGAAVVRGLAGGDGTVTEDLAVKLGEPQAAHLTPEWFTGNVPSEATEACVSACRVLLGLPPQGGYDGPLEARIRRLRAHYGMPLSGVVDEELARRMGELPCDTFGVVDRRAP